MAEDGKVVIGTELDTTGFEQGNEKIKNETKKTEKVQNETLKKVKEEGKKTYSELAKESGKSVEEIKKDAEALAQSHIKNGKTAEEAYKLAYEKMGLYSKETMKEMEEANKKLESELKRIGSVAEKSINTAFYGGVAAVTAFSAASVKLASDLTEVQNVVDTTFGKNSEAINAWAKDAISAYGLSELQAKKFTGTMGAMLKSSGLADDSLTEMSTTLVGLAGDFASFYNLDAEEAFSKIRAGISGETEPLKQLGINMSVANLEAYALTQGIETAYSAMSQSEQISLRYNYLLQAGADASGDFAKTLDTSFANQMRVAQEEVKSMSAEFGQKLLPYAIDGIKLFRENTDEIIKFGTGVGVAVVALKGFLVMGKITASYQKLTATVKGATVAQKALNLAWSTNPIGVVLLAVVALTGGLALLKKTTDKQTEAEREQAKAVEANRQAISDRLQTIKDTQTAKEEAIATDLVEIKNAERLYNELEGLTDANGMVTEANRIRAQFILGELNSALGLELELIDGQIQGLQDYGQSIQDIIAVKTAEIFLDGERKSYADAIKNEAAAYEELKNAKLNQIAIDQQVEDSNAAIVAHEEGIAEKYGENWRNSRQAVTEYHNGLSELQETHKGLIADQEKQRATVEEADEAHKNLRNTISDFENAQAQAIKGNYQGVIDIYAKKSEASEKALETSIQNAEKEVEAKGRALALELIAVEDHEAETLANYEDYKTKMLAGQEGYTEEGLAELKAYTDNSIEEAHRHAVEAYDSYIEVGGNMVDGIVSGINNNKFKLLEAVANMSSEAKTVYKKDNGINSPSKVYRGYAKDQVDGITLGIEQNKRKPIDEIKRLSLDMQAAFTSPLQSNRGAVYTTNNTNNSKTITQVFNTQLTSPFEAYRKAVQNV